MNCKPGDLAVITKHINAGKIVRVVRWRGTLVMHDGEHYYECWDVLGRFENVDVWKLPDANRAFPDAWLRPIRPGDISDEEVRDLYLPKVPEAA